MTRHTRCFAYARRVTAFGMLAAVAAPALAVNFPVTPQQRGTARQVAEAGVPLAELAPNAPDSYTVKRGDTLWDISKLFLRSPWRWPELWGMNLEAIRNPHLIFPGQVLFLERIGDRARLRLAQPLGTTKLSPRVRSEPLDRDPIAAIPLHLIGPFLNEAVVFNSNELATAPRVVASQEGRVVLSRGDLAYVRGDLENNRREWRVFREAKPLLDPTTKEVLGYEAAFLGTADYTRPGETRSDADGKPVVVPATFTVTSSKLEMGVGDRLAPVPPRDFAAYVPHAPSAPLSGRVVSIYGEGLNAGQNQIVALNKGRQDGIERGHVLALLRDGPTQLDRTDAKRTMIKLPDERNGLLFVFSVFDRVSYALILSVQNPVSAGDRFTQP